MWKSRVQDVMERKHERGESMARIIMCGSFKRGVGKTASSWNLAYSLAEMVRILFLHP